ncbi:MAG: hypothetical protein QOG25_3571, partial [Acetobacteraceae bacterium]|nr:hypothetical protein [Acetobacteraceae bacterium]
TVIIHWILPATRTSLVSAAFT